MRSEANEAGLKMGVLAYNPLHILRRFYIRGEQVRMSVEWLILRLMRVGARVSCHARPHSSLGYHPPAPEAVEPPLLELAV